MGAREERDSLTGNLDVLLVRLGPMRATSVSALEEEALVLTELKLLLRVRRGVFLLLVAVGETTVDGASVEVALVEEESFVRRLVVSPLPLFPNDERLGGGVSPFSFFTSLASCCATADLVASYPMRSGMESSCSLRRRDGSARRRLLLLLLDESFMIPDSERRDTDMDLPEMSLCLSSLSSLTDGLRERFDLPPDPSFKLSAACVDDDRTRRDDDSRELVPDPSLRDSANVAVAVGSEDRLRREVDLPPDSSFAIMASAASAARIRRAAAVSILAVSEEVASLAAVASARSRREAERRLEDTSLVKEVPPLDTDAAVEGRVRLEEAFMLFFRTIVDLL